MADGPRLEFDDARQARIHDRLARISGGISALFRDACRIMGDTSGLEGVTHFAAHACREIESGLRDVFRGVSGVEQGATHQEDIARILTSLGIEPEHPIAQLWLEFPRTTRLHEIAHRDRLALRPRTAFAEGWEQFQAIMDLVLDRHEAVAARAFSVIDGLLAHPSSESLDRFETSMPQNYVTLAYFFERAGPEWISPLESSPYLVPEPATGGGHAPTWPAADWVVRAAAADSAFGARVLEKLAGTSNASAALAALRISLELGVAETVMRSSTVSSWAQESASIDVHQVATAVAERVAMAGHATESIEIARAVLGGGRSDG